MADTFTTRMGLIMQAYGGNPETWGTELNNAVIALVDDAIAYDPITVNSDVTLTADNGLTNQVRRNLLVFTGAGGHTVTVKDVDRWYLVHNTCAADVTVKPDGGTGSTVRAGTCVVWCTDGSTSVTADIPLDKIAKPEADVDFNGKKIVNAGKGSDPTDVATLSNEFKDFAKPTADLDINGQKLTNVAKGTNTNDAATLANEIQHFAKPTAAMDMNGQKLTNVGAPTAPTDAATKGYIDTLAASSDLGTVAAVADEIRVLADIQDGTVASNTLTDLAPIKDEIVAVAGIKEDVAQLAGMFAGASATDPATRLDGSALQAGDFYLNTSGTPNVRVYTGNAWIPIEPVTIATEQEAEEGDGDGVMTATLTGAAIDALRPMGVADGVATLDGDGHLPADQQPALYVSADQNIVPGGTITLAHGFAVAPRFVGVYARCTTADNGYSVGDVIDAAHLTRVSSFSGAAFAVRVSDTDIKITMNNEATGFGRTVSATDGSAANLPPAYWKLFVKAAP